MRQERAFAPRYDVGKMLARLSPESLDVLIMHICLMVQKEMSCIARDGMSADCTHGTFLFSSSSEGGKLFRLLCLGYCLTTGHVRGSDVL